MKILTYGAGVLGCNLARNLFHAGKDVTLLARGNWAEGTIANMHDRKAAYLLITEREFLNKYKEKQ